MLRKYISGHDSSATTTISDIPSELVLEILTRLPGKQVGRCKCVCKPWQSMIRSRPFKETYRRRQSGLLLYWSEEIARKEGTGTSTVYHFSHCPLRQTGEPPVKFTPLPDLHIITCYNSMFGGMTNLVDGLLCVGEVEFLPSKTNLWLSLYNVGTGEKTRLPNTLPYYLHEVSTYHLGYDPESRVYKMLGVSHDSDRSFMGAHVMTLRPPSSALSSTWRDLCYYKSGLGYYPKECIIGVYELISCPDDGILCWLHLYPASHPELRNGLLCFDFSREEFRFIELPKDAKLEDRRLKAFAVTRFKDSLALWLSSDSKVISCYVLEDEEGKHWRRQSVRVSNDFKVSEGFVGKIPGSSSSNSNMFVMDEDLFGENEVRHVCSYSPEATQHGEEDVFLIGKLPEGALDRGFSLPFHFWKRCSTDGCQVRCLLESNHLYLSLDEVLAGGSATDTI